MAGTWSRILLRSVSVLLRKVVLDASLLIDLYAASNEDRASIAE